MRRGGGAGGTHVLLLEGLVGAGALTELVLLGGGGWSQLGGVGCVRLRGLGSCKSWRRLMRGGGSTVSRGGRAAAHRRQMRDGVSLLVCVRRSHGGGRGPCCSTTNTVRAHWPHCRDTTGTSSRTRLSQRTGYWQRGRGAHLCLWTEQKVS